MEFACLVSLLTMLSAISTFFVLHRLNDIYIKIRFYTLDASKGIIYLSITVEQTLALIETFETTFITKLVSIKCIRKRGRFTRVCFLSLIYY